MLMRAQLPQVGGSLMSDHTWTRMVGGGPREAAPGEFDGVWTLYNRGLDTLYASIRIALISGGAYTLDAGLEIKVGDGAWISTGGTLVAEDIIQVRATSSADYYVDGVSGTVALALTIGGVVCTFTLINMEDPMSALTYWKRVDGTNILRTDGTPIEVFE